jgi:hypothetical protein
MPFVRLAAEQNTGDPAAVVVAEASVLSVSGGTVPRRASPVVWRSIVRRVLPRRWQTMTARRSPIRRRRADCCNAAEQPHAHHEHHFKIQRRTNNRRTLPHPGDAMDIDPRIKWYLRLFGSAVLLLLAAGITFVSAVVMFMD